MTRNYNYKELVSIIAICLCAVFVFIFVFVSAGCSCENKDISSSAEIPADSSGVSGNTGDTSPGNDQSGSSDMGIGNNDNNGNSDQETPVTDAAALTGRWENNLISSYDNSTWGSVLEFSNDGTFIAFAAPEQSGATEWFEGNFTVSNGRISYDGEISNMDGNVSDANVRGAFFAFLTNKGKLILRKDGDGGLLDWDVAADAEYTKVQDTSSE